MMEFRNFKTFLSQYIVWPNGILFHLHLEGSYFPKHQLSFAGNRSWYDLQNTMIWPGGTWWMIKWLKALSRTHNRPGWGGGDSKLCVFIFTQKRTICSFFKNRTPQNSINSFKSLHWRVQAFFLGLISLFQWPILMDYSRIESSHPLSWIGACGNIPVNVVSKGRVISGTKYM